MDAIKMLNYKGYKIKIYLDDCSENPREWDNLGTLVAFDRRTIWGDGHKFRDEGDIQQYLAETGAVFLPVFQCGDSYYTDIVEMVKQKISFSSVEDYEETWAVGQYAVAFVILKDVISAYGNDSEDSRQKALSCLKSEVEVYEQWLRGEVYGFIIEDAEGNEIDSCWGFYSIDEAISQAKDCVPKAA